MNVVDLKNLLLRLHDTRSELLLLRSCMGIYKLFVMTCQLVVVCGRTFFGEL